MFSVAICDDDKNFLKYIAEYVKTKYKDDIQVSVFTDCSKLLDYVSFHGMLYDGIIMDICYDNGDGIETISRLYEIEEHVCVLYVTGFAEHMERIFDTNPCYFLRKPLNLSLLDKAIEKLKAEMQKQRSKKLVLKTKAKKELALFGDEIIYIESSAHKVLIHTKTDIHEVHEKLDNLENRLDRTFLRAHKSYLVNMKYIMERRTYELLLSNGETIAVSKGKSKEVKAKFSAYLGDSLWS